MKRLTFTAGIDKAGNTPMPADVVEQALADIRTHLAHVAGGYTETATNGGWNDDSGQLVQEHSMRWMILTDEDRDAESIANFIGRRLKQEEIAVEVEPMVAASIVRITAPLPKYPPMPVDDEAWSMGDAATGI